MKKNEKKFKYSGAESADLKGSGGKKKTEIKKGPCDSKTQWRFRSVPPGVAVVVHADVCQRRLSKA